MDWCKGKLTKTFVFLFLWMGFPKDCASGRWTPSGCHLWQEHIYIYIYIHTYIYINLNHYHYSYCTHKLQQPQTHWKSDSLAFLDWDSHLRASASLTISCTGFGWGQSPKSTEFETIFLSFGMAKIKDLKDLKDLAIVGGYGPSKDFGDATCSIEK